MNLLFINFFRCKGNRCLLKHIPKHLHQDDRPVIPEFYSSEKLFWRLGKNPSEAPYSRISLYDISVNRSGGEGKFISKEEDVLWNIEPNAEELKYVSEIITLIVKRLFPSMLPVKPIIHPDDIEVANPRFVNLSLVHSPLTCNYAHSMFVFDLNGIRVTRQDYSQTFDIKPLKRLRQACRDELAKAIIRGQIDI